MDVQADEASVRPDPAATAAPDTRRVLAAPRTVHQGSFFQDDPYPTFAKTDPTPAVPRDPARPGPARRVPTASRGLRIAVVVTALAVAAAGATLGLVEAGVISTTGSTAGNGAGNSAGNSAGNRAGNSAAPPATHPTAAPKNQLLTGSGLGPGSASYTVDAPAYGLKIATSTGRSWVSIGLVGQKPIFAGIVEANSSQHWTLLGPSQINIGAGGTTVTITSNKRTQSLNPPSAPFTYSFTPR